MNDRIRRHPAWQRWRPSTFIILLAACVGFGSAVSAQDNMVKVGGTGSTLTTMQWLGTAFEQANPGVIVDVLSSLGSTGGIAAILGGAINLGLSARPLTGDERGRGAVAREYGRSPLVFAVPHTTGVAEITMAEVIDIYAGAMTRWPDGTLIRLVLRPETKVERNYTPVASLRSQRLQP